MSRNTLCGLISQETNGIPTMAKINCIIIGGGSNSAVGRVHRDAISLSKHDFNIIDGCFSTNPDNHRNSLKMWGIDDLIHNDAETILEKHKEYAKECVVIILSPTDKHYEHLALAIKYGYSIICEKALVTNIEELHNIQTTVDENQIFIRNIFNYSGYPLVREIRSLILDGHIGSIQQIVCEMPQEGLVRPPLVQGQHKGPQSWRLTDRDIPMVCLDLGVHLHHLIEFTTGITPIPKTAILKNLTAYPNIKDTQFILFSEKNETVIGSMWFTKSAIGTRNGLLMRIFGSSGSIEWYQQNPEIIKLSLISGQTQIIDRSINCITATEPRYERMKVGHPAGFIEAFANLYDDIGDDYKHWRSSGQDNDSMLLGITYAARGIDFFAQCQKLN